jgi:gamma-glutamyltranspeptidase/glutathione hydrolase
MMRPPAENYLQNRKGAKSVSTPGTVNAWYAMSSEYGSMNWEELFEEAIRLANEGFQINSDLSGSIYYAWDNFSDYTKKIYGKEEKPLKEGEILIQEDLAKSFQQVKEHGPKVFYQGYIAEAIDKAMKETDGFLSIDDLKMDKAEWWEPIHIHYKGYEVYTASPPSTAFPSLIRLGIMSQIDITGMDHNSVEYLHYFAEASKHAFWCRLRYAGDPEIEPPPLDMLLSIDYWKKIAGDIDPENASTFIPPFDSNGDESKNTTHFVVADKFGNIVSATQTLGNAFGSRIMPEGTGIWLNNSLAYCTYEPKGNPMDAVPGQRKLSGDCPTIILKDGNPWAALGTPGGHTIGQTVPQMVMNLIDFKMDIQDALNAPRISFVEPDILAIEDKIDREVIDRLKEMGHNVNPKNGLGNAHGLILLRDDKGRITGFKGAADDRGEGDSIEF